MGILAILQSLLGFVDPLTKITKTIADTKVELAKAQNDAERMRLEERLKGLQLQLEAYTTIQATEAKNPISAALNSAMRFLIAFGPMVYLNKVLFWDKVVGSFMGHSKSGSMFDTDALSDPNLWWVVIAAVGFYMVTKK